MEKNNIPRPKHPTQAITPKTLPVCKELYDVTIALIRQHTLGSRKFHQFLYDETFNLSIIDSASLRLDIHCNRHIHAAWKREGIAQTYAIAEVENNHPLWVYTISGTGLPISYTDKDITCIARSLEENAILYNEQNAYKIAQTSIEYAQYIIERYKKPERLHTRGRENRDSTTIDTNGDTWDISKYKTRRI